MPEFPIHKGNRMGPVDYEQYPLGLREELECILEGLLITAAFAWFFYRSIYAFLGLLPIFFFYRKEKRASIRKKHSEKLEKEFRELLLCVSVNLQAGYSIENAFLESYRDMMNLFGSGSDIVRELQLIRRGINNKIPLEQLLADLGRRCPGGEIAEFGEVFQVAKKTGGKWLEVMKKTIDMIREKAELKEEIETLIHAKRMESRIMCLIPFVILLYIDLTSSGYFDPLYHNIAGICIMTGCLGIYCFSVIWMKKITNIVM
ncbi:MAG: type II secretion system F family protein [Lachnospiraceae bacterium]|nr:type II secretion system F family protein [Lachnospiraceae bacterium]